MNFVNNNQIKQAFISKPYDNQNKDWDYTPSHGWQLILIMEYSNDGYHNTIVIDCKSEDDCHTTALRLGLTNI